MAELLTREQVMAMAPDASSAKAATGLESDAKWPLLGRDDEALWGECQGSGSKPYQTQVDLNGFSSRCSCPSRKFPCKHGLALMLLCAANHPRFTPDRPPWVEEWIGGRRERLAKKEQAARESSPVDPEAAAAAAAKREAARWKRIDAGARDLELWISDQFRRGFAQFSAQQRKDWATTAARMVDAQAPGLASMLQQALEHMELGLAHYPDAIEQLGLIQLLVAAVQRRDALSPARRADVRAAIGWPLDKEEVIAEGETVQDVWQVLGQRTCEVDAKLSERRVWLHGERSGRIALIQEFAYDGSGFSSWAPWTRYDTTLHFYPGSVPLRAVAQASTPTSAPAATGVPHGASSIDWASRCGAENPWLPTVPVILDAATPCLTDARWQVHGTDGAWPMTCSEDTIWSLLAFSAGHPVSLLGEWNGHALHPLSAWRGSGERWHARAMS